LGQTIQTARKVDEIPMKLLEREGEREDALTTSPANPRQPFPTLAGDRRRHRRRTPSRIASSVGERRRATSAALLERR